MDYADEIDKCYNCGEYRKPGEKGKIKTIDTDIGDPEVGPDPDIIDVWVCDRCKDTKIKRESHMDNVEKLIDSKINEDSETRPRRFVNEDEIKEVMRNLARHADQVYRGVRSLRDLTDGIPEFDSSVSNLVQQSIDLNRTVYEMMRSVI